MNWKVLAIAASLAPFAFIVYVFNVSLREIFAVGLVPFVAASAAIAAKLFSQGLKFNYLVKKFLSPLDTNMKTISVRITSEFVTSTTFIAGEIIRIIWLKNKGIEVGKTSISAFAASNVVFEYLGPLGSGIYTDAY